MKYFDISEFDCKETGQNEMDKDFLDRLDKLREACGFPFVITSGYRALSHSMEIKKAKPGTHTQGIAADIAVSNGYDRARIVQFAIELGFAGIGVANSFVHVDTRPGELVMWVYQ